MPVGHRRANAPSIEYLLADLPVVTTENEGGRDVFFDKDYVRWVDPDCSAVAAAVRQLAAQQFEPGSIRSRTLTRMREHRRRFIDLVQRIYEEEAVNRSFEKEWPGIYCNYLLNYDFRATRRSSVSGRARPPDNTGHCRRSLRENPQLPRSERQQSTPIFANAQLADSALDCFRWTEPQSPGFSALRRAD